MSLFDIFRKTSKIFNIVEHTEDRIKKNINESEVKIKKKLKDLKKQVFRSSIELFFIILSIIFIILGLVFLVNRVLPLDLTLLIFGMGSLIVYLFLKILN